MDKYDEMIESERDYESEDYYYEQLRSDNLETKDKQEKMCWDIRSGRYYSEYP